MAIQREQDAALSLVGQAKAAAEASAARALASEKKGSGGVGTSSSSSGAGKTTSGGVHDFESAWYNDVNYSWVLCELCL